MDTPLPLVAVVIFGYLVKGVYVSIMVFIALSLSLRDVLQSFEETIPSFLDYVMYGETLYKSQENP